MSNKLKYLIIPPMPTPNGALHLGHIGGPYLGADILTRYLRLSGHDVVMMSGTDCYESFVQRQAETEKKSIKYICNYYHQAIKNDFADMQINMDQFINPLHSHWNKSFRHTHYMVFNVLKNTQMVTRQYESVLWDEKNKRYVTGCWLDGNCPFCLAEISGYFCDECGGHFRPEQVRHQYDYISHNTENLFLKIPFIFNLIKKGLNHEVQMQYRNFLKQQNGMIRLSANTEWGLHFESGKTLFSYSFVYAYYLFLGEIAGKLLGIKQNAFAVNSGITTIASFGIDNAVPVLASVLGINAHMPDYKEVDYYLVNYFYHLNNSKFSTSRRHAIWVKDIIGKMQASSDIVRLYLASIDVRSQHNNFDGNDFIQKYNYTVDWIIQYILKPMGTLPTPKLPSTDSKIVQQFIDHYEKFSCYLQPHQFFPHASVKEIDRWLDFGLSIKSDSYAYFWWLKGLAILINPFMPQLSERLWIALGYKGMPTPNDFSALPITKLIRKISINLKTIDGVQLQQCIDEI